jgi:hypothetical protein
MTPLSPAERNRLMELLADDALGMLDASDSAELGALRARAGVDRVSYDDIVAGLILAGDDSRDAGMPRDSADRLKAAGRSMLGAAPSSAPVGRTPKSGVPAFVAWTGWLAAAAGFVLAASLWFGQRTPVQQPVATPTEPTIVERMDGLLAEPETIVIPFAAAGLIEGRENAGDLVWNPRLQRGFLRVAALDANDPAKNQYQLWIFDKARETYAVDGGVFDVASTQPVDEQGRTIIPFEPALRVSDPAAFAVTIEQPGGVVVTDQTGLVLLAPVGG